MMGVYKKHTKHVSVHAPARLERAVRFTASGPGTLFAVQTLKDLTVLG